MNPLDRLPRDKALHAIGGALIFAAAIALGIGIWIGVAIVAVAGALKEGYDRFHPARHTADVWDWVATVSLAAVIAVAIYLSHIQGAFNG